ncbi:MAG: hypothetical protein ACOVO3_06785 [Fluviicola sp.]|jgi:hypothetical protein
MGLVNSFINQIGRELGRDTYRSVVSAKSKGSKNFVDPVIHGSIYDEVIHFELHATDNGSFRQLANLVERAEHTDPEDFEWQELFYELDNKIEFCKSHLPSEYQEKLDQLDRINATNYQKIKTLHVAHIDSLINQFNVKLTEENTTRTDEIIVKSLVGLRDKNNQKNNIFTFIRILCLVAIILFFISGYMSYVKPEAYSGNLSNESPTELNKVRNIGIFSMWFSIGLYVLFVLIGLRQIKRKKANTKKLIEANDSLNKYKQQLLSTR